MIVALLYKMQFEDHRWDVKKVVSQARKKCDVLSAHAAESDQKALAHAEHALHAHQLMYEDSQFRVQMCSGSSQKRNFLRQNFEAENRKLIQRSLQVLAPAEQRSAYLRSRPEFSHELI